MLQVTENSVQQRPDTDARFVAPDTSAGAAAIARGTARLGQGLGDVADFANQLGEQYDTAAVKQADAEDLKAITEIRAKALSAQGFDAQAAIGDARQQIDEIRKARVATLHNNRQRQMYTDVFDRRNLAIEESFASHSITETRKAEQTASLARADSYSDLAVQTFGTKDFDANMATTLSEVAAANAGAGPDAIARQQAKVQSSIVARAIDGMLTDPDQAAHAELAITAHHGDLLPDDETKLRAKLNPILREAQTDADVGRVLSGAPVPGEQPADPLAPTPDASKPTSAAPAPTNFKPVDIVRGKGTITNNALQHRERGSGNALDIAAPAGSPIYPPMSGKVQGEPFWTDRGGWQVLIKHPNGYVTGYAHMSSRPALHAGQDVDNTTAIGSVGQTGHATGPHVHFTVRTNSGGPKVDPASVSWVASQGDPKNTVNPTSVSWKEGPLTRYSAEQNTTGQNLDRLYQIASKENWSPQRYQRAVDKLRSIGAVQESLYNDQKQKLYDSAIQTVVNLHDKFTSVSQIPNFGLLAPPQQLSLQNMADANLKAGTADGAKADSPAYFEYLRQTYEDRRGFIANNQPKFLTDPNITNGERASLYKTWQELRQDPNGSLDARMSEAHTMAVRVLPKSMKDTGRFEDQYMAAVQRRQQELGKPLSDQDKKDIAVALATKVLRYTPDGKKVDGIAADVVGNPGAKANVAIWPTYDSIPLVRRNQIINYLAAKGLPHSAKDVVAFYLQNAR